MTTEKSEISERPTPLAGRRTWVAVSGILLAGTLAVAYWNVRSSEQESTEDAYVDGNVVQLTPQTTGTVTSIHADNTDVVQSGQVMVALNPADAQLALQRAEAQLAKAVRQVRSQYALASQMRASITQRQSELSRAQADVQRRAALTGSGAVSSEEYRHAQDNVNAAQAALKMAEQQFAASQALVDQTSIAHHPDVAMAAMQLREAYLGAARTTLRAPVGGMVTRRNVQLGQRVSPGMPLLSVVSLDQLWVNANFKESQLRHLRTGQAVRLTADVYGSKVEYTGHVHGLDAGTGNAFSLMPAQNASGNWIKVVQRVPVRIALDPAPLSAHPLRLGLSMQVEVDTRQREGTPLAPVPSERSAGPAFQTSAYDSELHGADALIERIVGANGGIPSLQSRSVR